MAQPSRRLTICVLAFAFGMLPGVSAQVYTTVDFPGGVATTLNGGPNPEGTIVGSYTDSANVRHGFVLRKGAFTPFDPPGSTSTMPNQISPEGASA